MVIMVLFFVSFAPTADAVVCTTNQREKIAKAIAARDLANINVHVVKGQLEIETTYQAQLTASLEAKYAAFSLNPYLESIRPIIKAQLDKQLEKARKDRTRASTRAIERKKKDVESAEKKINRLAQKVSNPGCTL